MAACGVGEDERARVRTATGEVQLDELACHRLEELGLASALRLRRGDLLARERALDAQALPRLAAVVEDVAPLERVRLRGAEALVGEHTDERRGLLIELTADRFDRLRGSRIDR